MYFKSGRGRLLLGTTLFAIVLTISSCSSESTKLTIGYIPIAECVPLYVAQEKGFFEYEGLEVDLLPLAGGAVIMNYLDSRTVDIGFSNVVSLVLKRANDFDFVSIYGATYETPDHQNHALLTRGTTETTNIRSAMLGKTIAVNTKRNIEEMMVKKFLAANGIPEDSVMFLEVPFPRMLPYLDNESVDFVSIVEPFISVAMAEKRGGYTIVDNQYLNASDKVLVATYVSSERIMNAKRDEMKKFCRAMKKATAYIKDNDAEIRQIIGSYTKIPANLLSTIGLSEFEDSIQPKSFEMLLNDMVTFGYIEEHNQPSFNDIVSMEK